MTRVIHYICNIKIKDFLLCQYVIYGPRKKSIIDKYCTDVTNYSNTHAIYKKGQIFQKRERGFKVQNWPHILLKK